MRKFNVGDRVRCGNRCLKEAKFEGVKRVIRVDKTYGSDSRAAYYVRGVDEGFYYSYELVKV